MTQRIGILGGSFNPVHLGHLIMAQTVLEELRLDKVIFVPVHFPPHKSRKGLIDAEHRLKMVRLAVTGNRNFLVSDFETQKAGKSYSIDTLEHFRSAFPEKTKFYFIIGEDMLQGLKHWRRFEDIVKIATFAVVSRSGYPEKRRAVPYKTIKMPLIGISSSGVRQRIAAGKTVKYLVPPAVERYIEQYQLY